jgi:hypothetical protein
MFPVTFKSPSTSSSPGYNISDAGCCTLYHLNIVEYSISGSGTDQGMEYIEP